MKLSNFTYDKIIIGIIKEAQLDEKLKDFDWELDILKAMEESMTSLGETPKPVLLELLENYGVPKNKIELVRKFILKNYRRILQEFNKEKRKYKIRKITEPFCVSMDQ